MPHFHLTLHALTIIAIALGATSQAIALLSLARTFVVRKLDELDLIEVNQRKDAHADTMVVLERAAAALEKMADRPAVSWEELERWKNAPSNTASA